MNQSTETSRGQEGSTWRRGAGSWLTAVRGGEGKGVGLTPREDEDPAAVLLFWPSASILFGKQDALPSTPLVSRFQAQPVSPRGSGSPGLLQRSSLPGPARAHHPRVTGLARASEPHAASTPEQSAGRPKVSTRLILGDEDRTPVGKLMPMQIFRKLKWLRAKCPQISR